MIDTDAGPQCPTCGTQVWIRWDPSTQSGKCQNKHMIDTSPAGDLYNSAQSNYPPPEWTVHSEQSTMMDALAIWLAERPGWEYVLECEASAEWRASFRNGDESTGKITANGRGATAHEATTSLFNLSGVPRNTRPVRRTSIFDRNLNPAGPDRHA